MVVVVLPTPPFWLHIAMMRAGPWLESGGGLREVGQRTAGRAHRARSGDLGARQCATRGVALTGPVSGLFEVLGRHGLHGVV